MNIYNRRYIGSKRKLVDIIYELVISSGVETKCSFLDLFAGTGVVGYYFATKGYRTILNDTLYSNVIAYKAFLDKQSINLKKICSKLDYYNSLISENIEPNYFSQVYGKKYFSFENAKLIGFIREDIEKSRKNFNEHEYAYLLTSLIYASDKIANTVGHYESYLKNSMKDVKLKLEMLDIVDGLPGTKIFNEDANELVRKISADIIYVDPPYNQRQYVNFYHVLENLARWEKPSIDLLEGNSMKMPRQELKSGYCRTNQAKKLFADLISNIDGKLIIVSYNNTYSARSQSSNNTIELESIIEILKKRGELLFKELDYKPFNSGKTTLNNHKEYLLLCKIRNEVKNE